MTDSSQSSTENLYARIVDDILPVLDEGGIILYPTDTIWGVGCDAFHHQAVDRIFQLKNRPGNKKLICLVSSIEMLKQYVPKIHPRLETLLFHHERPLTIIYDRPVNLPRHLLSDDGSIGIRIARDSFCQLLIERYKKPLIATSANISDRHFPNNYGEISTEIIKGVDKVIKLKQLDCTVTGPSVIAKIAENGDLTFLRT